MGNSLRVGVLGAGWAGRQHVSGFAKLPTVELVVVCDTDAGRARALGSQYGVALATDDPVDVLRLPDLDAISITTPNVTHAPLAIAALRAGLHVLCEKPMATSVADAREMVRTAQQRDLVLDVAFTMRQRRDVRWLRDIVAGGSLGRIYHSRAFWVRRTGIPSLGSWITNQAWSGGGALVDIGVHALDLAMFVLDEPVIDAVSATTHAEFGPYGRGNRTTSSPRGRVPGPVDVEDAAFCFLRSRSHGSLQLDAVWAGHTSVEDDLGLTLLGSGGGAELRIMDHPERAILTLVGDVGCEYQDGHAASVPEHVGATKDFVDTILSTTRNNSTAHQALTRASIIESAYASARLSREVAVGQALELPPRSADELG
jgi:predicted dehydrogenase